MSKSLTEFLTRQGVDDITTLAEGVVMIRVYDFSAVILEDNKGYVVTEYFKGSITNTSRYGLIAGREFLENLIRKRFDRFAVFDLMLTHQGFERYGLVGKNVMNATFKNSSSKARIDLSDIGTNFSCTIWMLDDEGATKGNSVAQMTLPSDKLLAIMKDWEF